MSLKEVSFERSLQPGVSASLNIVLTCHNALISTKIQLTAIFLSIKRCRLNISERWNRCLGLSEKLNEGKISRKLDNKNEDDYLQEREKSYCTSQKTFHLQNKKKNMNQTSNISINLFRQKHWITNVQAWSKQCNRLSYCTSTTRGRSELLLSYRSCIENI